MLIFPIAKLIVAFGLRRQPESKENPGGLMVVETVFPMIGGLFAAWLILPYRPEWVFPIAAITVGAHYFGFRSAYGDWTYWGFGGILCGTGFASILFQIPDGQATPFLFGVIELLFGIWFLYVDRSKKLNRQNDKTTSVNDLPPA